MVPEEKNKKAKKKKKRNISKVDELRDKAIILGMTTYDWDARNAEIILVYNGQQHSACMFVV